MKIDDIIVGALTILAFLFAYKMDKRWMANRTRGKTITWSARPWYTSSKSTPYEFLGYVDESEDEDDLG